MIGRLADAGGLSEYEQQRSRIMEENRKACVYLVQNSLGTLLLFVNFVPPLAPFIQ